MRRNITIASVRLFVVVQVFIVAGVANAQTMKVACVGDSITAPASGWCRYLGTALGSGYMTKTFGVSGTTLLKNVGQPAFSSSAQYKPSHDFAPNIVVIMLGTNDSATRNWSAGKDHFVKDYEELIDSYTSLATKPIVILNTPPPASDDNQFTITGTTIEKEINPLIKQVAMTKMCPVADVWAAFGGDVEMIGSFDGVHPGDAGQMKIADTVAKVIMMPMIPGATGGMGASAGSGAGSGGMAAMAGAMAMAGANAGGTGVATAGTGATAGGPGGSAGTPSASGAGTGASTSTAGSRASEAGSTSSAGGAGSPATAGNISSSVNPVGAAGSATVVPPTASGDDGGCRTAGSSTSNSGPTATLVLLFGVLIRSRRRNRAKNTLIDGEFRSL